MTKQGNTWLTFCSASAILKSICNSNPPSQLKTDRIAQSDPIGKKSRSSNKAILHIHQMEANST